MTERDEQMTLPTIERVIVQEPEPTHKPPRGRTRSARAKRSAGTERVKVDDTKAAPKARAKAVPKSTAKEIESLTVTGFDVAQWILKPNVIFGPEGQPQAIWPIDRSDPMDNENLRAFADNAAKLINRLPDWARRYLIVTMSGGAIGAEVMGMLKSLYYLVGSRLMLQQLAKQPAAPANEQPNGWAQMFNQQQQETAAD